MTGTHYPIDSSSVQKELMLLDRHGNFLLLIMYIANYYNYVPSYVILFLDAQVASYKPLPLYVTGFAKRGLIHASDCATFKWHNFVYK